jgi:mannose-1-phosphate guanylyltransferase
MKDMKLRGCVKAVILAGGLGTRLNPYTLIVPKPMLTLGNRPILEYIIEWLKESKEIDEIILSVSYLYKLIENYFENGSRFGIDIKYIRTKQPMGTAGQLKAAEKSINNETFVCLNSDHIYKFKLNKMIAEHFNFNAFVSMALLPYKIALEKRFVNIREISKRKGSNSYKIVGLEKEKEIRGLINIGCYIFEPGILQIIPSSTVFPMDLILKKIIDGHKKLIRGYLIKQELIDIGDKRSYLDTFMKFLR